MTRMMHCLKCLARSLQSTFVAWATSESRDVRIDALCNASRPRAVRPFFAGRQALQPWLLHGSRRSGMSCTIIGASSLQQLETKLNVADLTLTPEQPQQLDAVSKPVLNFHAAFLTLSPSISHAGATVNGIPSQRKFLVQDGTGSGGDILMCDQRFLELQGGFRNSVITL